MIQYEETRYLFLLIMIPILIIGYLIFYYWKKSILKTIFNQKILKKIVPSNSFFKGWLKQTFLCFALVFMIFGLVNPQIGTETETVKREGVDLVFAIDVSKSMLAEDIAPNRLEKSKRIAGELINQLVSDRVGIIAYASSAIPHLPITTDYAAARMFLASVDTNMISSQGTSMSSATNIAMNYFDDVDQSNKVVCLLSDGEDHGEDALSAAKNAAKNGIIFISIVVGTEKGAVIPIKKGNQITYKKNLDGEVVITKSNFKKMNQIAYQTNGFFIEGINTDNAVREVIEILKEMDKKEFESKQYVKFKDQFQWFLLIGLTFITLDIFLLNRKTEWLKKLNLFNDE